jgi:hypothetical protein
VTPPVHAARAVGGHRVRPAAARDATERRTRNENGDAQDVPRIAGVAV